VRVFKRCLWCYTERWECSRDVCDALQSGESVQEMCVMLYIAVRVFKRCMWCYRAVRVFRRCLWCYTERWECSRDVCDAIERWECSRDVCDAIQSSESVQEMFVMRQSGESVQAMFMMLHGVVRVFKRCLWCYTERWECSRDVCLVYDCRVVEASRCCSTISLIFTSTCSKWTSSAAGTSCQVAYTSCRAWQYFNKRWS